MKRGEFLLYLVHAFLQYSIVKLRQMPTCNGSIVVGSLHLNYEEGDSSVEEIEEVKTSGMGGMVSESFKLVASEHSIALATSSRCFEKKMTIVHSGMQLIFEGLKVPG